MLGRDSFQEVDFHAFEARGLAARVEQPTRADELPGLVAELMAESMRGRPKPVVLALPEDVLTEETDVLAVDPQPLPREGPREDDLRRVRDLLASAERPLVITGEGGWTAETSADLLAFCEQNDLAAANSFRCQDYVSNYSPIYAGHLTLGMDPQLAQRVRDADAILAVGGRLGDISTQDYTLIREQRLIHVHPGLEGADIRAHLPEFAAALRSLQPLDSTRWRDWTAAANAGYLAYLEPRELPGDLDLGEVVTFLNSRLSPDAIITCGAGNFTTWVHRYYRFSQFGTQLAPRAGAMGYGLPAALAAKTIRPDRTVVCLAGDGDFMMSAAELATAVQYELPVIVLVVNNGMYGTIRMHQERHYPGRVVGTDLVNPDFADFARSFGCHGDTVERTEDFAAAFERAAAAGTPAVLDLRVDPEAIHPRFTIAELRGSA
jgi:acetolactate synthase-1/2/3 large subunit